MIHDMTPRLAKRTFKKLFELYILVYRAYFSVAYEDL